MYKSSIGPIHKKKKTTKKKVFMCIGLCLILAICFILLKMMYIRQNVILQNTWQSKETGQILTFNTNGSVDIKGTSSGGIYHIISPNTMEYTVDGKTFQMIYQIVERTLYWGLNDKSLESFQLVTNPFNHLS